jgi:hypothetical protein
MILVPAGTSRPVRAVVTIMGGWIVARAAILWPAAAVVDHNLADHFVTVPDSAARLFPADLWVPTPPNQARPSGTAAASIARGQTVQVVLDAPDPALRHPTIGTLAKSVTIDLPEPVMMARARPDALPPIPTSATKRLSGSVWALARSTAAGPGLANGGQLGGSQIGARISYAPGPQAFALTARISTPLGSKRGREGSVGFALRGKTVGVIIEQRFALDKGGRDAPSVTIYGGMSDVSLGSGIRLDGYAQAGVVGVKHRAGFIDAAVRLETTVIEDGGARLSAGVGLSGGAQPGVSRGDIGPQLVARVPVGDTAIRVSAEWRQRIAGNAAPGSGPAVTVGFDF